MANKFTEKALIQLHKYNCPASVDVSNNIMIDVSVKRTLNNDLVFTCPFCVSKRKRNLEPYTNSKPILHIHGGADYGSRHPHCSVESCLYYGLPKFEFNLVEKTSYVPFHH
tara:strand:- start:256 stop:588 length:333 start_codon:yes stop_codon:yes gene_type:complete